MRCDPFSTSLLPVAEWAKMLLNQELLKQEARLHDSIAEGLEVTKTGKFLLLLSDLALSRTSDNSSVFTPLYFPTIVEVTKKDLQVGALSVHLPALQKLLRIKTLDQDGKPTVGKTVSYVKVGEMSGVRSFQLLNVET